MSVTPLRPQEPERAPAEPLLTVPNRDGLRSYGAKLSAVVVGASALVLFAGGPPLPFRITTWVLVLAELEEIAITTILPEWRANVPSILHARRLLRDG